VCEIDFAKGIEPVDGAEAVIRAKDILDKVSKGIMAEGRESLLARAVLHYHREHERLCLLAGRIEHLETTDGETMDWIPDPSYPCDGYYIVSDATHNVDPGERSEDPLGAGLDALERLRERSA
jgi:hypothetical protein